MRKFKTKLLLPLITAGTLICGITASANAGIERSATGEAFTTDRYVTDIYEGELGETVNLRPVNLLATKKGQHRYTSKSVIPGSDFPIAKWTLKYPDHTCIHNGYPPKENGNTWKGFSFGRSRCYRSCQPGWIATCAKCGRELYAFFYATRDTISQVKSLTNEDSYVSNCVDKNCNNLETGFTIRHNCDDVSWNRYTVKYYGNGADGGYLSDSSHYYNNATEYEGEAISPQEKLTKSNFCRTGYVFTGWNTKMDGNGTSFSDEEDFINIQTKLNLGNDDQGKEIRLYAQWKPAYSTLIINPNGGSYDGETSITQRFRSTFTLDENKLTPPNGFTVLYDTQGGNHKDSTYTTMQLAEWSFSSPLYGMYNVNYKQYLFGAYDTNNVFSSVTEHGWHDGCIDTVTANYAGDSFKLPEATYPNGDNPEDQKRFGGWYADPECTIFIGGAGDDFSTDRDMTLYAKWSNLHLDSEEKVEEVLRRYDKDERDFRGVEATICFNTTEWTDKEVTAAAEMLKNMCHKQEETKLKNKLIAVIVVSLFMIALTVCNSVKAQKNVNSPQSGLKSATENSPVDKSIIIWTDPETKIQYIVYREQHGYAGFGGITPRLNSDGSLYITKEQDLQGFCERQRTELS